MPDLEPEYRQLGENLRRLRRHLDYSQEFVAGACGMSRSTLANIEAGQQRLALHQFLALARALEVEPTELLPPKPPKDQPVDEQLVQKGVPERAARAVARVMGKTTGDGNGTNVGKR